MNVLRIQGRLVSRIVAWTRQDLGKIYLILAGSPGGSRVWKGQFRGSGCRPGCRWELCAVAAEGKGDQRHHRTNLATFPGLSNVGGWEEGEFRAIVNSSREMGRCNWLRERAAFDLTD